MISGYWGEIAGLGAAAFTGLTGIFVKAIGYRLSAVAANAARCTFAAGVFSLLWLLGLGTPPRFEVSSASWIALSVLCSIVLGDTLFFLAIRHIGVSRATPLAKSYPALAVVLGFLLLGEPLGWIKMAGVATAVCGTILISGQADTADIEAVQKRKSHWRGVLLALGSAVSWSVGLIAIKQSLATLTVWQTGLTRMALAAAFLWPLAWRAGALPTRVRLREPATLLFVAAIGTCLSFSTLCMLVSVAKVGAGLAAVYSSMAPLFAVPLGAVIFGERLNGRVIGGAALSMAGVVGITLARGP